MSTGSDTSAAWFTQAELPEMDKFVDRADALVLCRSKYSPEVGRMISRAKARGIPILFDVDDFVFNPDYAHLVMHTLDQETTGDVPMDFWFAYFARHGSTLRLCDGAITTNPYLGHLLKDVMNRGTVRIIPNFLNREQQALSQELYSSKREDGFMSDNRIHIGYFSGTPSHRKDFAIVADALANLMDENPNLHLRIVGFLDPQSKFARHSHRVEQLPLTDFMNLQRLIAEVEINIAPLQNNIFTNCKSDLKYFEAAIVGTMTLASPTSTFRAAISDGENGFLVGAHEWGAKLRCAIDVVAAKGAYADLVGRAFDHSLETYGWDKYAAAIETAVLGAAS
jgi:glycosyltransferase involved in cell wall biosynthesis